MAENEKGLKETAARRSYIKENHQEIESEDTCILGTIYTKIDDN